MKFLSLTTIAFFAATLMVSAQPFNAEIIPEGKDPFLLGKINKEKLTSPPYSDWFVKNYEAYQPNTAVVYNFKETLKHYTITAFMGTWCGDSKQEIPRFYKILEMADFPMERLTLVAVSRDRDAYKQSPGGEEEGLTIHRVPTFIFYKDGKEVNRIVESPVMTLEADIDAILKGTYASNYQTVALVSQLLKEVPLEKFDKKVKKMLPKLKKLATKVSELNTYSNVLFFSERQEEAIAVALLNTLLFPKESAVYSNVAGKFYFTEKQAEALLYYEKALALDPENAELKSTIAGLKQKDMP